MGVSQDEFKRLLGRWTTGVTVVTSVAGGRIHGMTVSAFSEVSLEPPLVLICADLASNTHALIAEGGVFAVNVLARGQEELSNRFASKREEARRFEGLVCTRAVTGAPILPGSVAALDCRVVASHPSGDHVIHVGEVLWLCFDPLRKPLLYQSGRYGEFTA